MLARCNRITAATNETCQGVDQRRHELVQQADLPRRHEGHDDEDHEDRRAVRLEARQAQPEVARQDTDRHREAVQRRDRQEIEDG